MHPEILRIGPTPIYSYGIMLVISFLLGTLMATSRARQRGLPAQAVSDVATVILIAAIVGSRALYVAFHADEFRGRWLDTINLFKGLSGLSMFGGIAAAIPSAMVFLAVRRIPLWPMADVLSPSYALGVGITRIGCLLNGCCFGRPTTLPWGISFPPGCVAHATHGSTPLHPTQLYESASGFLILALVLWWERRRLPPGVVTCLVFGLYGLERFLVDFLRSYEPNNFLRLGGLALASSQVASLALMGLAAVGLVVFWRRAQR